jgi:hypothetical protein
MKRTGAYTDHEDLVICEVWMKIAQNPICGVEHKGETLWKKISNYFHEHKHLGERPFERDRSEASITKRWGFIPEKCTNLTPHMTK